MKILQLAAPLLSLAVSSQAFKIDFVRWEQTPYSVIEESEWTCRGRAHNNVNHLRSHQIHDGECHTEKEPFVAFIYDKFVDGWDQHHSGSCDLLFYDEDDCGGNLVFGYERVNHPRLYCVKIPTYAAKSVKMQCRPKGQSALWKDQLIDPPSDVTTIPTEWRA